MASPQGDAAAAIATTLIVDESPAIRTEPGEWSGGGSTGADSPDE